MQHESTGRFRVLDRSHNPEVLVLVSVPESPADRMNKEFNPVTVEIPNSAASVVSAGNLIEATLSWPNEHAQLEDFKRLSETTFEYIDDISPVFEAASTLWQAAVREQDGLRGRVTRGTDSQPNGVLYVFAEQSGVRNLFDEFQSGTTPLEPLLQRVDDQRETSDETSPAPETEQDRAVFILRPVDDTFVIVYITFEKYGVLANTIRSTYGDDESINASGPLRFHR
ncbi:MAG: hypothetical protein J07HQX50_00811 [Haloquadratum sp. J07HQX50]|jgi:hypothetical protein|nr:MAG: hypothetical protein J07HQX50_00811 [Haloquadratum sp. J07HQX50]